MHDELTNNAERWWQSGLDFEEVGDWVSAEKSYYEAARLGHSMAQLNLANILDDYKIPRDPEGAVRWYIEAWKGGESSAAWNLSVHYKSIGLPDEANAWRTRAAQMGHPEANGE